MYLVPTPADDTPAYGMPLHDMEHNQHPEKAQHFTQRHYPTHPQYPQHPQYPAQPQYDEQRYDEYGYEQPYEQPWHSTGPQDATWWEPDHRLLSGICGYDAHDRSRLSGPDPDLLEDHVARYGPRPVVTGTAGDELLVALEEIRLTGRGGAHFPVAKKWRTVLAAGGGGIVVGNGAEGEPASAKDAALLQHRPHLVLDGLACAAEVVGATGATLWLHEGAVETRRAVVRAIGERRAAGFEEIGVQVVLGPDHYLSGESSAAIQALDGGPPLPAFTRVPAAVKGIGGRPTLLQNVETLARVALIARTGATGAMPGMLVTVLGDAGLTVCELPPETTVAEAVRIGNGAGLGGLPPQAVLLGGYGGSWMSWAEAAPQPLGHLDGRRSVEAPPTPRSRRRRAAPAPPPLSASFTASLGAGVMAVLPADVCGIVETAAVVEYLATSSARQCGPCVFGTRDLADTLARISRCEARRGDLDLLTRIAAQVVRRGACHLPDGAVQILRSALHVFAEDLEQHVQHGRCAHPGGRAVLPVPGEL